MNPNDPADVILAAIEVLQRSGKDTHSLETRFQDVDVAQVVGRWPLQKVDHTDFGPLAEASDLLKDTQSELQLVGNQAKLLGDIDKLINEMQHAIRSIIESTQHVAPPSFDPRVSLNDSLTGKWPPD